MNDCQSLLFFLKTIFLRNQKSCRLSYRQCLKRTLPPMLISLLVLGIATPALTTHFNEPTSYDHLADYIQEKNPMISEEEKERLLGSILIESARLRIPARMSIDNRPIDAVYFVTAMIAVESSFQRRAISSSDARGYMQLMIPTATWMDHKYGTRTAPEHLFDTRINISRGVFYLNYLFQEFENPRQICLAYNAGPGSYRRGIYIERYWKKVLKAYRELAAADRKRDLL